MNSNSYITQDIISILKDLDIDLPECDSLRVEKLEAENRRLKRVVSEKTLMIRALNEQILGQW